jgi:hypothetical protein
MMKAALTYTQTCIRNVKMALAAKGLNRPIVIGEAGWKTTNSNIRDTDANFRAHAVNQKMFYDAFTDWVYGAGKDANSPRMAFWFEAFDEPWKNEDDMWGLFDLNRKARFVMWNAFPDLKPEGAPDYRETDAVYYIAPPPSTDAAADVIAPDAADAGSTADVSVDPADAAVGSD